MKTNFILMVLVGLAAVNGCKENKVETKPIEGERIIVPKINGKSIETFAYAHRQAILESDL
jgi:hypothetical protein